MFSVHVNEGSSRTEKLLYNIQELLVKLTENGLNKGEGIKTPQNRKERSPLDLDSMTRLELIGEIKKLPKGTIKGKWITFDEKTLREELKKVT